MKNDTILTIGLIGIGAYVVYKLIKPLQNTVSNVGEGLTSPLSYAKTLGEQKEQNIITRETVYREGLKQPKTVETIYNTAYSTEQEKYLKQQKQTIKESAKLDTVETKTKSTVEANKINVIEQTQRKIEYGTSPTEYLSKMFLPTKDVAEKRREVLKDTYSKVDKALGGLLPAGARPFWK